ncbi:MAG: tetratricopeptide repeat protein [Leeuwenhoekiella sp.]
MKINSYLLYHIFFICIYTVSAQYPDVKTTDSIIEVHTAKDSIRFSNLVVKATFLTHSDPEVATQLIDEAETIAFEMDWELGKATATVGRGQIAYVKKEYVKALMFFQEADRYEVPENPRLKPSIYISQAAIYADVKDYENALKLYFKVLDQSKNIRDPRIETVALSNIGLIHHEREDYTKALKYQQKALDLSEKYSFENFKPNILNNLAIAYHRMDSLPQAIRYFKQTIASAPKAGDYNSFVGASSGLAELYLDEGERDKAKELLEKSKPYMDALGNKEWQVRYINLTARYNEQGGNYKEALAGFKKFMMAEINRMNDEEKSVIVQMQLEDEMEKQENLAKQQISDEKQIQLWLLLGGGSLVALTLMAFYFIEKQRNKKFKTKEESLRNKAMIAQLNPHFIYNGLNQIKEEIHHQNPDVATAYLGKFSYLLRRILEASKEGMITLEEEINLLKVYLNINQKMMGEKFKYAFRIAPDLKLDNLSFPALILQPLVENAIVHGIRSRENGGGKVEISVTKLVKDSLLCKIVDNGIVQDQKQKTNGRAQPNGLEITRERLGILERQERSKAALKTFASPQGFTAEVIVPYRELF